MDANKRMLATFGGSLLIEIKPADVTTWKFLFLTDATPIEPLAVEAVIVQDIGPIAQDQQIRRLKTENSGSRKASIVEGKIKHAFYARISIAEYGDEVVRSILVFLATA